MFKFAAAVLLALVAERVSAGEVGPRPPLGFSRKVIDDMEKFFNPGNEHHRVDFMDKLDRCLAKWDDPIMPRAADSSWKGFADYYHNKSKIDPWVNCLKQPFREECSMWQWSEGEE